MQRCARLFLVTQPSTGDRPSSHPPTHPVVRTGLAAQTVRASLGSADAFICHSWHDDPDSQFAAFSAWMARFQAEHDGRIPSCWYDRACIDSSNIGLSIACLPCYLAGCKELVVLAGPTFMRRLWCIMELFSFVQMGGATCRQRKGERMRAPIKPNPAAWLNSLIDRNARSHPVSAPPE